MTPEAAHRLLSDVTHAEYHAERAKAALAGVTERFNNLAERQRGEADAVTAQLAEATRARDDANAVLADCEAAAAAVPRDLGGPVQGERIDAPAGVAAAKGSVR